jgi:hypothetical protein
VKDILAIAAIYKCSIGEVVDSLIGREPTPLGAQFFVMRYTKPNVWPSEKEIAQYWPSEKDHVVVKRRTF